MPQAANIVLADALATPANHTFIPVGFDPKDPYSFLWEEQSTTNASIGNWLVRTSFKRPGMPKPGDSASGSYRVKVELHEPVMETLGNNSVSGILPAPTVAYIPRSITEFILPQRSTLQNRKDLRKMHALLLADAQIVGLVENFLTIT